MKVAVLADIHYGVRGDSAIFLDHLKRFWDNTFFPYIEQNEIDTIIIAGDLVDRRKFINFNTLRRMREDFVSRLSGKNVYIIAGNHDVALKNTNSLNALTELLREYNFNVFINPEEVEVGGKKMLFLPWICQDNYNKSMEMIRDSQAYLCVGHLELEGFEMHLGTFCHDGLSPDIFARFHSVLTGHFHHKSSRMNIHYLGAPYQMTWADYDDPRGFHVLDTESGDLTYIVNPDEMYIKVVYNDTGKTMDEVMNVDFDVFKNSYVKVIATSKENAYWFDLFIEEVEKRAIDTKIQECVVVTDDVNIDGVENTDIENLLRAFVDKGKYKCDKNKLMATLMGLYTEALSLEV